MDFALPSVMPLIHVPALIIIQIIRRVTSIVVILSATAPVTRRRRRLVRLRIAVAVVGHVIRVLPDIVVAAAAAAALVLVAAGDDVVHVDAAPGKTGLGSFFRAAAAASAGIGGARGDLIRVLGVGLVVCVAVGLFFAVLVLLPCDCVLVGLLRYVPSPFEGSGSENGDRTY